MLVPPNPNELLNAMLTFESLDIFGTKSKSQFSEGFSKFKVAGIILLLIDNIDNIDSTLPAAPSRWPIEDFVELTIIFGNDALIKDLNKSFRNKDAPTNVLAFPTNNLYVSPILPNHIGDVFLAFETCKRELLENKGFSEFPDHICHLIVHGVLHLLGHKHDKHLEAKKMESLEIEILAKLGVKNPYE